MWSVFTFILLYVDNALSERRMERAKYVFLFIVASDGNIDLSKITILANFNLNPVTGHSETFKSIRQRNSYSRLF